MIVLDADGIDIQTFLTRDMELQTTLTVLREDGGDVYPLHVADLCREVLG